MFHYVYILESETESSHHYTGRTKQDVQSRLIQHNAGQVPHTAKFKPWRIGTYVSFTDENKAIQFERYLKTGSGREFARRHF